MQNLANNVVVFENEARGTRLMVADDGAVGFDFDNTERSLFVAELCGGGQNGNVYLLNV